MTPSLQGQDHVIYCRAQWLCGHYFFPYGLQPLLFRVVASYSPFTRPSSVTVRPAVRLVIAAALLSIFELESLHSSISFMLFLPELILFTLDCCDQFLGLR